MSGTYKRIPKTIKKSAPAIAALQKLRSFLDPREPILASFLYRIWGDQSRAITYKELREAILAGEISAEYLEQWQQDYARFVVKYLAPQWEEALEAGAKEQLLKYDFVFDPMGDGVIEWTENRAAQFVTNSTNIQIEAVRAVVRRAATLENLTVDQLARVIRPMVGLTKDQSIANLKYYNKLIEKGLKEKKAQDLAAKYAARQHRYRGMMIARQELAMAYNSGADEGIRQAQAAGIMGDMVKVFCCADDERVCPVCGSLEGKIIGMNEEFPTNVSDRYKFTRLYPPVHIQCRCVVLYEEVSPPIIKPQNYL